MPIFYGIITYMRKITYLFFAVVLFSGCTGTIKKESKEDKIHKIETYYENGKYQKVLDALKDQISYYIYTKYGDDAEYYLAMSYFHLKDYDDAIPEFEFLINTYPNSPYREKSYYFLALSHYKNSPRIERDQDELKKALQVIRDFETEYPSSPLKKDFEKLKKDIINKLSLKMIDIIKTYYNLEKYTSSLLYINLLRKEYPNTEGENLSYLFEALIRKEEGMDYTDILSKLNTKAIPKRYRKYYKKLLREK